MKCVSATVFLAGHLGLPIPNVQPAVADRLATESALDSAWVSATTFHLFPDAEACACTTRHALLKRYTTTSESSKTHLQILLIIGFGFATPEKSVI